MEELNFIVDARLPEIKVGNYMEISTFYIIAGKRGKAQVLLEEYYENADEKDKKYIIRRIDNLLNKN